MPSASLDVCRKASGVVGHRHKAVRAPFPFFELVACAHVCTGYEGYCYEK